LLQGSDTSLVKILTEVWLEVIVFTMLKNNVPERCVDAFREGKLALLVIESRQSKSGSDRISMTNFGS
jgi:hypothetical protein